MFFSKNKDAFKEAKSPLKEIYGAFQENFGLVPHLIQAQSLRPDLAAPLSIFFQRLMLEDHELALSTKELVAAYVSKINSCPYWLDAHSAMVMAQGYTKEEVIGILENVEGSTLIDNKTKVILCYTEKVTRNAYDVTESDIQRLRQSECSDKEILESTFIIAYYNAINRMADALGAPIENLVERFQNN